MAITKPQLDIAKALTFATEPIKSEKASKDKGEGKIITGTVLKTASNTRIFFAPEGDKRLTINLNAELHKKLKIAAFEQGVTAGEIIERLLKDHI